MQHLLPLEQFLKFEKELHEKVFLRQPLQNKWTTFSWTQVGLEARKFATALQKLNFPPKSCIAILSKNCAHWMIADLGIWMAGHISVPLYPTSSGESIRYVLEHCQAKLLIAGKLDDWSKQKAFIPAGIPKVGLPFWQNEDVTPWNEFLGSSLPMNQIEPRAANDISTIIYTSGTTGKPKGVVHTFLSMSVHVPKAIEAAQIGSNDRFFSYLPMSHVAERLLIELGSLYTGGEVSFAESLDSFKENLKEVRPTIFLAVPRIWLKFQQGILQKVPQKKLSLLLSIPLVRGLIQRKIKTELGLNEVHIAFTGAAAISKELLEWFAKLGIQIQEVYGMTENFCVTSFNFPGKEKFGTVGTIWPFTKAKIGENQEILTWSESNMLGYYQEPEMSAAALSSDGWLHTGDQGEFDSEGYLKIIGRVKDLFKTSKGKYVSPASIEKRFEMCDWVEQVCVMGSNLPQPVALVVLSESASKKDPKAIEEITSQFLKNLNKDLETYERIKKIIIVEDQWSVENGLLTPTLKIKRNEVERKYAAKIDQLFRL